jgi:peptidoglycan hydrolase-like protein with peptidoglycan-binding domain
VALTRVPLPSPNYNSRNPGGVRLIVLHTAEGARTIESLANWFANPANEVSSHAGADDKPNTIGVFVHREDNAWTQGQFNGQCVSLELCGFAAWDSAEWHRHPNMLENCAAWIAEESQAFGIPLVRLSAQQAQGGGTGVCQHIDLGAAGGGHVDCGSGFPMDEVLAMAGGTPGAAPAPTPPPPAAVGAAPPWPGRYLQYPPLMQGTDVTQYQRQMASRGWTITADGQFGPQSSDVTLSFQREKGMTADGIVGPDTWNAAFTAPVT